jgi:DNA-binding LacI/PurR family transcriptional regulator
VAATIKEVARMAGCSITTVSRAFNDPKAVHPDTLKRIHAAAEHFKYSPNTIARAMVKQRNHTIAFVVDEKHFPVHLNPFYAAISEAVREQAEKLGYNVYVVSSKAFSGDASQLIKNKSVDGAILAGKCEPLLLEKLYVQNAPLVLVNSISEKYDLASVTADDYNGTVMAVEHLIGKGHTRIGLMAGNLYSYISGIRQKAFMDTMESHGYTVSPEMVMNTEADIASAMEKVKGVLQKENPPTAFFCMNDVIAVGVIKAAIRLGLTVPEDVAVIGFDNSNICTVIEPELTSISIDTQKMGSISVIALDKLITGKKLDPNKFCLDTSLIERQST